MACEIELASQYKPRTDERSFEATGEFPAIRENNREFANYWPMRRWPRSIHGAVPRRCAQFPGAPEQGNGLAPTGNSPPETGYRQGVSSCFVQGRRVVATRP